MMKYDVDMLAHAWMLGFTATFMLTVLSGPWS
jgi:hypothetical protein